MDWESTETKVVVTGRESDVGSVLIGGVLVLLAILMALWMFAGNANNGASDNPVVDTTATIVIVPPDPATEPTTAPSDPTS